LKGTQACVSFVEQSTKRSHGIYDGRSHRKIKFDRQSFAWISSNDHSLLPVTTTQSLIMPPAWFLEPLMTTIQFATCRALSDIAEGCQISSWYWSPLDATALPFRATSIPEYAAKIPARACELPSLRHRYGMEQLLYSPWPGAESDLPSFWLVYGKPRCMDRLKAMWHRWGTSNVASFALLPHIFPSYLAREQTPMDSWGTVFGECGAPPYKGTGESHHRRVPLITRCYRLYQTT
jgi:hypothetical protein